MEGMQTLRHGWLAAELANAVRMWASGGRSWLCTLARLPSVVRYSACFWEERGDCARIKKKNKSLFVYTVGGTEKNVNLIMEAIFSYFTRLRVGSVFLEVHEHCSKTARC